MEDYKTKKWYQESAGRAFFVKGDSTFTSTNSSKKMGLFSIGGRAVKICIRCQDIFPLNDCSNCGHDQYTSGVSANREGVLICKKCGIGQSSWICPKCQAVNLFDRSLALDRG